MRLPKREGIQQTARTTAGLVAGMLIAGCANLQRVNETTLVRARHHAAWRPRRLVFNNDGDDHILANGRTEERIWLCPDRIQAEHARAEGVAEHFHYQTVSGGEVLSIFRTPLTGCHLPSSAEGMSARGHRQVRP